MSIYLNKIVMTMQIEKGAFMNTYFIADTHFGDENIRRYGNRPYESISEMDKILIENWNNVITETDEVYILGDFGADGYEKEILAKLNGIKYLVKGNHDVQSNDYYRSAGFKEVYDLPVLYKNFWILSNEAIYVNRNMPYANLFGHVHNSPMIKDYSSQHFCVSAERIDYAPISFDKIAEMVKELNSYGQDVSKNAMELGKPIPEDNEISLNKFLSDVQPYINHPKAMEHMNFNAGKIVSDILPGGIPYMEKEGEKWMCVTSYDDMRGPQGIHHNLSYEEAIKLFGESVDYWCNSFEKLT